MTIEEAKKLAKEQYGKDLTEEQAKELAERADGGELSDEVLGEVAGGTGKGGVTRLKRYFGS